MRDSVFGLVEVVFEFCVFFYRVIDRKSGEIDFEKVLPRQQNFDVFGVVFEENFSVFVVFGVISV